MNLVIDIGNTSVKAALFKDKELDSLHIGIEQLLKLVTEAPINKCALLKSGESEQAELILSQASFNVWQLTSAAQLPFTNKYATPATVGADRLALVAGAKDLFPNQDLLCIDTGTCITYNFITAAGEFLGGAISPGIDMRFKALNHYTANLPLIEWSLPSQAAASSQPPTLIGDSTASSILSGVLIGIAAEVDGTINLYKKRYSAMKVVVTGGTHPFFVAALENAIFARPNLVLHGLNAILEYNT